MSVDAQKTDGGTVLRFRLDRTLNAGAPVLKRICNLNCIWCHHDYMDHTKGYRTAVSNQVITDCINHLIEISKPQKVIVRISGDGEPTLVGEEELIDLIVQLKRIAQVSQIKLTTNGILLGNMAHNLKDAGLDGVTISLNSLDPNIYYFYSGKLYLDRVLDSIQLALEANLRLKLNVIYSRLNAREFDDFLEFASRNQQVIIKIFDLIPYNDLGKRLYLPLEQLEEKLKMISHENVELTGAYFGREYVLSGGGRIRVKIAQRNNCPNLECTYRSKCLEGCRTSIRIRADGILQPCGVREDNVIDLLSPDTNGMKIIEALKSGGKL